MRSILLVSFGSTHQRARIEGIDPVARRLEREFPNTPLVQAYTSGMVRRALDREGISVPCVSDALDELAREGATDLLVQPTHVLPGEEHERMRADIEAKRSMFERVSVGEPLLSADSDFAALAEAIGAKYARKPETALVLMGHGTTCFANAAYAALDYRFKAIGRDDAFVGTVEAYPALSDVMSLMKRACFRCVDLVPLMLVAGDHAVNDMASEESDSWASVLSAAGYEVTCHVEGLGSIAAVQDIYAAHARSAWEKQDRPL